ncbi:hypothetical protein [Mycobacterium sp. IS-1556]|uniref:hypothetical protein n=1 Tax=Mycobacterium sp. IS-1556 TaxID=1772276 RepID=UPI0007415E3D|nr:hypothetical protein [Mycobacterium sp. IS-1556]KUH89807.1 hypothetical protein AU187_16050 [Mycobacterium sp. IS-1556]
MCALAHTDLVAVVVVDVDEAVVAVGACGAPVGFGLSLGVVLPLGPDGEGFDALACLLASLAWFVGATRVSGAER